MNPANLKMLIALAVTSRDAAAAHLAQMRQNAAQAQAQWAALQGYAREYAQRSRRQAQHGLDSAAQANWLAFDGKLEQAVAQQAREVERRNALADAAESEFVDMQRRVKSLETLAARQVETARLSSARRDQKLTDEIAARANQALARLTEHPAPVLRW
jgi:flagellar FliJ protein